MALPVYPTTMAIDDDDEKPRTNGWLQWNKYVLKELERLNQENGDLQKELRALREDALANIRSDIRLLKFQATLLGAAAGGGFSIFLLVMQYVLGAKH